MKRPRGTRSRISPDHRRAGQHRDAHSPPGDPAIVVNASRDRRQFDGRVQPPRRADQVARLSPARWPAPIVQPFAVRYGLRAISRAADRALAGLAWRSPWPPARYRESAPAISPTPHRWRRDPHGCGFNRPHTTSSSTVPRVCLHQDIPEAWSKLNERLVAQSDASRAPAWRSRRGCWWTTPVVAHCQWSGCIRSTWCDRGDHTRPPPCRSPRRLPDRGHVAAVSLVVDRLVPAARVDEHLTRLSGS